MASVPVKLEVLLEARTDRARDDAWAAFLEEYSDLIRFVARRLGGDEDTAMDRYSVALGALRKNNFRRLRQFKPAGSGKFSTWLVAVTRRLCIDEHRRRYGRPQGGDSQEWRTGRRNLADLVATEFVLDQMESPDLPADAAVEQAEITGALECALAELTPGERLLLRYRFEDGLSVPEIARIIGRPSPFPVYREIEKLIDALRQRLSRAGVEWPGS